MLGLKQDSILTLQKNGISKKDHVQNNSSNNLNNGVANNSRKTSTVDELAAVEFVLPETSEAQIMDYTQERIKKWLEEMEDCNVLVPPSQLTWRGINTSKQQQHEFSRNFNHEYCLSDYDSIDEQIVEYNRVVDKTFHIVHDDTACDIPLDQKVNENEM